MRNTGRRGAAAHGPLPVQTLESCCRTAPSSFDKLRMRSLSQGIILTLSLSKGEDNSLSQWPPKGEGKRSRLRPLAHRHKSGGP